MKRLYLLTLHVALAVLLARSLARPAAAPEPSAFVLETMQTHDRLDAQVPEESVLFVGDSITQGLYVARVTEAAVNLGISGDTTIGVLARLPRLTCVPRARAVVMAIGVNDLRLRSNEEILANFGRILRELPGRVVWSAVLPVDERAAASWHGYNQRIRELNADMRKASCGLVTFVDAGELLADALGNLRYHVGDGVHLDARGYAIWAAELRRALRQ
jgi:lysophospholipase L1-like esterase